MALLLEREHHLAARAIQVDDQHSAASWENEAFCLLAPSVRPEDDPTSTDTAVARIHGNLGLSGCGPGLTPLKLQIPFGTSSCRLEPGPPTWRALFPFGENHRLGHVLQNGAQPFFMQCLRG